MKDLSPKMSLSPAEVELTTAFISGEFPLGQNIGGAQNFSDRVIRGYGDKVFGQSSQGIWLGAADFVDAPFRVDMEGQVTATGLDLSQYLSKSGEGQNFSGSMLIRDGQTPVILIGVIET